MSLKCHVTNIYVVFRHVDLSLNFDRILANQRHSDCVSMTSLLRYRTVYELTDSATLGQLQHAALRAILLRNVSAAAQ